MIAVAMENVDVVRRTYAVQCMKTLIESALMQPGGEYDEQAIARSAFKMADAMLKAEHETQEEPKT